MIHLFHRFANKNKIILFVRNYTFVLLILTNYQLVYCSLSLQRKVYTLNLENYSSKYSSFKKNEIQLSTFQLLVCRKYWDLLLNIF